MQTEFGRIARFKKIAGPDGNRYQFFCDLSGALIRTSAPVILETPEQELKFAWESDGKKYFNICQRCGKWVSDTMFNADVLECVACTPWENELNYCPQCGYKLDKPGKACPNCGVSFFDKGGQNDA
jgi:hypothetical protein